MIVNVLLDFHHSQINAGVRIYPDPVHSAPVDAAVSPAQIGQGNSERPVSSVPQSDPVGPRYGSGLYRSQRVFRCFAGILAEVLWAVLGKFVGAQKISYAPFWSFNA